MKSIFNFDENNYSRRWLAYFDLLGTRHLIESQNIRKVFSVYDNAINEAKRRSQYHQQVTPIWFSDTFVFYSEDDSGEAFASIDAVSRWFVYFLIQDSIPVRGAISCGEFYADRHYSLYFGPPLVEAYEYGEAQDWIGFLLTPSAVIQIDSLNIPSAERYNYCYWQIPFKSGKISTKEQLPACILGQWNITNGENLCLNQLARMKLQVESEDKSRKYRNSIDFIERSQRTEIENK